jgi:hypothetical protein
MKRQLDILFCRNKRSILILALLFLCSGCPGPRVEKVYTFSPVVPDVGITSAENALKSILQSLDTRGSKQSTSDSNVFFVSTGKGGMQVVVLGEGNIIKITVLESGKHGSIKQMELIKDLRKVLNKQGYRLTDRTKKRLL